MDNKVYRLLSEFSGKEISEITNDDFLYDDLGIDSLQVAFILSVLFPNEVDFEELNDLTALKVADIVSIYQKRNLQ